MLAMLGCLQTRRCSAISAGIPSRLVKAENVGLACGDLAQVNIARRDIPIMLTARGPLPLLPCNGTEAQKYEYYSYSNATIASVENFIAIMCFAATPSEGTPSIRRQS